MIDLNRAVAVAMAHGPAVALPIVDELIAGGQLAGYPFALGVRAELLERLGRADEARVVFRAAADLTRNEREKSVLLRRAEGL